MSKHKMLWMLTKMYQKKKGRCFTFIFHLPANQPYIQDFFFFYLMRVQRSYKIS